MLPESLAQMLGLPVRIGASKEIQDAAVAWVVDSSLTSRNPEVYPLTLDDILMRYVEVIRTAQERHLHFRTFAISACRKAICDSPNPTTRDFAADALLALEECDDKF